MPNIVNSGAGSFIRTTGMASRRVGYIVGFIFIAMAFLPKVSALFSTIPGPVMTGYLLLVTGTLFVDGARTIIQTEQNQSKVAVAGICFWIGAAFQFSLFSLPDLGPVVGGLFKSGITTGGFAAIVMILYLEAVEEAEDDSESPAGEERRLEVVASSEGPAADLEFIGGASNEGNIEDRIRQVQQHDSEVPVENEMSLRLLRGCASSVRHQQYHGTEVITVRVLPPGE